MNPISDTAWYCAGVRMLDAESKNPLCGDNYANNFMDENGMRILNRFIEHEQHNIASLVRHKIIDDLVNKQLTRHPETTIILIGAGFDTRAFRFDGGFWVEIDEPEIIKYKNTRLAIEDCKNKLIRIEHDFSTDRLDQCLDKYKASSNIFIIIEGVLRYLGRKEIDGLILTLKNSFNRHNLVCDLMDQRFYEEYAQGTSDTLEKMNAPHRFNEINPERYFQDRDYRLIEIISVVNCAFEHGLIVSEDASDIDKNLLLNGYSICRFEYP